MPEGVLPQPAVSNNRNDLDYHQSAEAQEYVQDLMEKASASADQLEEEEEEEEY